jgi:hypothetical protein
MRKKQTRRESVKIRCGRCLGYPTICSIFIRIGCCDMKNYLVTTFDILLAFIFFYGLLEVTHEVAGVLHMGWPSFLYGYVKLIVLVVISVLAVLSGLLKLRKGFF